MPNRSWKASGRGMAAALCVTIAVVGGWGFVRTDAAAPPDFATAEIARHDEIAYWELVARFPQIPSPATAAEHRFNEVVRAWADRFAERAQRTMATHPVWEMGDGPSKAVLDYMLVRPKPGIVEIVFRSRIDYGVDLSVPLVHRLRVDLETGAVTAVPDNG